MHLLFTPGFSNEFFQALCWTLIHSLWQGLIAAVMAAVIVSLTKRSPASLRYNLLITVLLLFVISITITACHQFEVKKAATDLTAVNHQGVQISTVSFDKNGAALSLESGDLNLTARLTQYLNEHALTIVLVWFLLFLIKCAQLIAGLRYLNRIRRRNNYQVSFEWKELLFQLAEKTGIRSSIVFLESELINVPAVIGFLKPVLLVPAGLLLKLPAEQVEAILLHELAHIRRRDFFVNLVQSFIETFLFFNPAVVWISSLVRQEREACCDDMVIARLPEKESYLKALVCFQEMHLHRATPAMALSGNKHYLFNRVKRMLTQENKKLNLMEKTALLLGIIGISAFGFISKQTKEIPATIAVKQIIRPAVREVQATGKTAIVKNPLARGEQPKIPAVSKNISDTLPEKKAQQNTNTEKKFPSISSSINNDGSTVVSSIEATDNEGKQYRIKRVDGKITELVAGGVTIPQSQYSEYDEVIRQIDETQRHNVIKRKEKTEARKAEASKRKEFFAKKAEQRKEEKKDRTEKRQLKNEMARQNNSKRMEERKLVAEKKELRKAEFKNKKALAMQKEKLFREGRKPNDDISRIISELNNRKLVSDKDNLSFTLTSNELIVNGTKQSSDIHQQFKEKYIHKAGDRFNYSRRGNTTSITINRE